MKALHDVLDDAERRHVATLFADNIFLFLRALRPYVAYVQDPRNGFSSVTLALGTGTEYSVRL